MLESEFLLVVDVVVVVVGDQVTHAATQLFVPGLCRWHSCSKLTGYTQNMIVWHSFDMFLSFWHSFAILTIHLSHMFFTLIYMLHMHIFTFIPIL